MLWDTQTQKIVSNESGDILRMLNSGFGDLADNSIDLYPEPHRAEIDALNDRIYDTVNDASTRPASRRTRTSTSARYRPCS